MARKRNPNPRSNQVMYEADIQWLKSEYNDTVAESISKAIEEIKRLRIQEPRDKPKTKNPPEFDAIIKEAKNQKIGHENMAKNYIPAAYRFLVSQGYQPIDAGDKIRDDYRGCWNTRTISKLLPDEAKRHKKSSLMTLS